MPRAKSGSAATAFRCGSRPLYEAQRQAVDDPLGIAPCPHRTAAGRAVRAARRVLAPPGRGAGAAAGAQTEIGGEDVAAPAVATLLVAPVRAVPKRGGQQPAGRLATPLYRPVRHGAFPLPPHGSRDGAACSIRAGRRAAALIARCPRLTRAAASPRCRRQN